MEDMELTKLTAKQIWWVISWCCLAVLGILLFIFWAGIEVGKRSHQEEAIKNGVAEWIVDTQAQVHFKWKPSHER